LRKRLQRLHAGLATVLKAETSLAGAQGQTWTREALLAEVQSLLAAFAAVDKLVTQLAVQRQTVRGLLPRVHDTLEGLETALRTYFGVDNVKLRHFGIKPKKPRRRLKSGEQVAANVKKAETRQIRHTLGKKQKGKLRAGQ